MICQHCGTVNEGGDRFCGSCGAVLVSSRPVVNPAPAFPGSPYGSSPDAPTLAEPLPSSQPTQYVSPPTQYVAPGSGPGAWAAQQGGYAPPPVWPDQPVYAASPAGVQTWPVKRSRRRRWPWYLLLFLLILGLVVSASWVVLLRPTVHQSVDGQIRQGLQQAIDQISPVPEIPPGVPFPVTADDINAYLAQNASQLAPITSMQVSLQPGVMVVNFQAYGFGSTVRLGLAVQGNTLVAQNVSVSGLLWWVESADDLTARFDAALGQVPGKLGRQIASVNINDGAITFIFA